MAEPAAPTILCLSSYEKGAPFLEECQRQGWRVVLITVPELEHSDFWPRDSIDEFYCMPDLADTPSVIRAVAYLARTLRIERVVPLDEYELATVGALREQFRLAGMSQSATRFVRDKLAMRLRTEAHGLPVPPFVHVLNNDAIQEFLNRVPAPWLIKPRSEASTIGIRKIASPDQAWAAIDELGDERSNYLIERFVPGNVFHADSLVANGEVAFVEVHRYARPPLDVFHQGGIASTATVRRDAPEAARIRELNRQVLAALGVENSATHMEFIQAHEDGRIYFLEVAARVGGAYIADVVEAATGVNLWVEWAKIETLPAGTLYHPPAPRRDYAGVIISLARQEWPDTSAYQDPEIVWRLHKANHAGFVVRSPEHDRVVGLLDQYARRFTEDFLASMPPWTSKPPSDS
ncbi:MAG TPA: ATP-grasp domain-containing protein [Chloroflexota bacterium]|jgi:biotin carboxylase